MASSLFWCYLLITIPCATLNTSVPCQPCYLIELFQTHVRFKSNEEEITTTCCHFRFIRYRLSEDAVFVGVSLFNNLTVGNKQQYPVPLTDLWDLFPYFFDFPFYVIIRVNVKMKNDVDLFVDVGSIKRRISTNRTNEQEFGPFQMSHTIREENLTINFFDQRTWNLNGSYVMFCVPNEIFVNYDKFICHPVFVAESGKSRKRYLVRCLCRNKVSPIGKYSYVWLPLVLVWLVPIIIWHVFRFQTSPVEEDVRIMLIMCTAPLVKYQYELDFCLGMPSQSFDMAHSLIDIELLDQSLEIIGTPLRYDCKRILNPIRFDLKCVVGKIIPFSPVEAIRINHTGNSNDTLMFHTFTIRDSITREVLQHNNIQHQITGVRKLIRLNPSSTISNNDDSGETPEESNTNLVMNNYLPIQPCSLSEWCLLMLTTQLYGASLSLLLCLFPLESNNLLNLLIPAPLDHFSGAIYLSLIVILFTLLMSFVLLYLFRDNIKRYLILF